MRRLKPFILFSILLSSVLILIFIYSKESEKNIECGTPELTPICGTKNLTENQSEGKNIFNENCTACHNLRKEYVGPNLMKTDSLVFFSWLSKNSYVEKKSFENVEFDIKYHRKMWNEKLNDDEILKVYQYCRYFSEE